MHLADSMGINAFTKLLLKKPSGELPDLKSRVQKKQLY